MNIIAGILLLMWLLSLCGFLYISWRNGEWED